SRKDKELAAVEEKVDNISTVLGNDILFDEELFARVKAVHDSPAARKGLEEDQVLLLDDAYKSFARNGAELDAGGKKELREINEKLSALYIKYEKNIID